MPNLRDNIIKPILNGQLGQTFSVKEIQGIINREGIGGIRYTPNAINEILANYAIDQNGKLANSLRSADEANFIRTGKGFYTINSDNDDPKVLPFNLEDSPTSDREAPNSSEYNSQTIAFERAADRFIEYLWEMPRQRLEKEPDGWFRLEATVEDTWQLRWWLLSKFSDLEVREPFSLREQIKEKLSVGAQNYSLQDQSISDDRGLK